MTSVCSQLPRRASHGPASVRSSRRGEGTFMGLSVGTSPELAGVKNVYVRLLGAASVGTADERGVRTLVARAFVEALRLRSACTLAIPADRPSQREKGAHNP